MQTAQKRDSKNLEDFDEHKYSSLIKFLNIVMTVNT